MTTSKFAVAVAGALVLAVLGSVAVLKCNNKTAAAQQNPSACACAPYTTVTPLGTNLVHCQCGPATCVVSEHITGQAKTYNLQCVK